MNSATFVEGEDWLYCGHNNQIIKWDLDSGVSEQIYKTKNAINSLYSDGNNLIVCKEDN